MLSSFYIAWRYIAHHRVKSIVLVSAMTLILFLPLALRSLVHASERQLMARAVATPLIVGARGSSLDLAIDTLYFEAKTVEPITMADADEVDATGLARAIPMYTRFRTRNYAIVGTTLDYFDFRQLRIADGRQMAFLGECLLGATVARDLGLACGDYVVSSPENFFDLAGTYPLKMKVAGVLRRSHTPDDRAVFVDLKTSWVIAGLGHGHQDLSTVDDPDVLLGKEGNTYRANAKLMQYNEITPENVDSFHFHGPPSEFPLSAILAIPHDKKSEDLLRGRYIAEEGPVQIFRPAEVIRGLTDTIFKVEGMLNAAFTLMGCATGLLILLVVLLSIRLRQPEISTMYMMGCARTKIVAVISAELAITAALSAGLAIAMTLVTLRFADEALRLLIL